MVPAPPPYAKMRPVLTLIIFIALTGKLLASGGILFYTLPGASYVSAVQYEALSTPTAHIVIVSLKGGKRMQIAASGIVSDIPLPDAMRSYAPSEIELPIAQCEMIALQHPKYAANMEQVAEMWRRRSNATAQSSSSPKPRPAAGTPKASAPMTALPEQTSPVELHHSVSPTDGGASMNKIGTDLSVPLNVYVKQLADALLSSRAADLADVLKQPSPVEYSQAHADLVAFQAAESKIQTELKKAMESRERIVAEANRMKRNADISDRPNPLNSNDRSGHERAQRERAKAKEMIESSLHSIERLKESCSDMINITCSTVEALVKTGDYEVALALSKRIAGLNAEIQPKSSYSNRVSYRSDPQKIAVKLAEAQLVLADVESAMGNKDPKGALSAITNKYGKNPEYRPLKQKADFLANLLSSNTDIPTITESRDMGGQILQRIHITHPI